MQNNVLVDQIFEKIAEIKLPHFFVTVQFKSIGNEIPDGIETFLWDKLKIIKAGVKGRKFVFQKCGWRLIFTFFPTNEVVDDHYALKNKVQFL